MIFKVLTFLLLISTWSSAQKLKSLNEILSWKVLEYGFHSDNERQYAVDNGLLTENTGTPIDVAVQYRRDGKMRVFTTIPRFSKGIPFTLATVSTKMGAKGPVIYPYPDYDSQINNNAECNGIISAFRVAIDACNQMWVIDSGVIEDAQICPPQLLTYDLSNGRLINRYQFPRDLYTPVTSLLINLVVDTYDPPPRGRCRMAMVYIADVTGPGLLVYDSMQKEAWRVENSLMAPDPAFGTHTVAGESFDLMDGMFAINLTPARRNNYERNLYFHALASDKENKVPLSFLNNKDNWRSDANSFPEAFRTIGERGRQAAMETMDSRGNLFTNTEDPLTIVAWNIDTPFRNSSFKIVANNPEQLQFASGMKVVVNARGEEELWISTCRFQKIATGTLNPDETNFRILACRINDLLSGMPCRRIDSQLVPYTASKCDNLVTT